VVGHDAGGVYSVGRDDRDLGSFTSGPGVGTAPADLTTQVIEFTGGSSGTFGVFATEGTGASATIRYTNVNQSLGVVGSSGTFATGSKEFSVSHNPFAGNYGVMFRTQTDNLNFVNVGIDGTVSAIEQPTAADANADQAASIHYVGGANGTAYAFNGNNTPFAGLFTATNGGLNCLRLTATGAPVVPSFQVNSDPSFYGTTWTGNIGAFPANELGAAHHGAGGLDLEMLNLEDQAAGLPTCTIFRHFDLKGAAGITYVNTPSIAWNGVEFAIGYDTQSVIGGNTVRRVGVFIMNPLLTAAEWTDRTFDGAGDPAGERPSITWANDRWILRYAISGGGGVRVVAGSLAP